MTDGTPQKALPSDGDSAREFAMALQDLAAINTFLSHDLRSPMRFIHAFAQILESSANGRLTADEQKNLLLIRDGVTHMDQMIADVLRYTRLERRPVRRQKLDAPRLLQRVFDRIAEDYPAVQVTLETAVSAPLEADSEFTAAAVRELFDNAFKAIVPGRLPRIEAGVVPSRYGSAIYVRDNGIGFDPAQAESAFTLFRRLTNFHDLVGTGVGLALVRRVADRHEGRAWAESTPGEQTTVYLALGPSPGAGKCV